MANVTYQVFFERRKTTVEGYLTVVGSDGSKPFDRIPVRSGQRGYTGLSTLWKRGNAPCPPGKFNLWTDSNNKGQVAGLRGIGEAFPICNQGDRYTIKGLRPGEVRQEIMLHEENSMAGSKGCIVVISHTQWMALKAWLLALHKSGVARVPLTVFFKAE